jgi:hypothetical protein
MRGGAPAEDLGAVSSRGGSHHVGSRCGGDGEVGAPASLGGGPERVVHHAWEPLRVGWPRRASRVAHAAASLEHERQQREEEEEHARCERHRPSAVGRG